MTQTSTETTDRADETAAASSTEAADTQVVEESLVEEVSIDGMCGVY